MASSKKTAPESSISAADVKTLDALDASYEAPPNASVALTVQEARELEVAVRKVGAKLIKGSRLDAATVKALPKRRAVLEAAEKDWQKHRSTLTPKALKDARAEAERLREDGLAAIRYFCAEDADAQKEVDGIREGSGVADLIEDLGRVADLLDEHKSHLKAADLAKGAAARARVLAEELASGTADHATDTDGAAALALRNRAFWFLHDDTAAIREAAHYVFRRDPKTLALFREHVRHAPVKKPAPAPVAAKA